MLDRRRSEPVLGSNDLVTQSVTQIICAGLSVTFCVTPGRKSLLSKLAVRSKFESENERVTMSFAKDFLDDMKNQDPADCVSAEVTNILLAEIAVSLEQSKNVAAQESSVSVSELAGVLFRAGVSSSRQVAMHLLTHFAIQARK